MEKVNGRDAFVIDLKPNPKHKHESRTVNRIMDQLETRVWIDREEFQISQLSTKLLKPVNFLGGLAGAIKTINIGVTQKRLAKDTWVDEKVNAHFDVRVAWKNVSVPDGKPLHRLRAHRARGSGVGDLSAWPSAFHLLNCRRIELFAQKSDATPR